ncbi:MAG: proline--tRNA ligase [Sandaracinaceae bacterium]|nr:proline--tRNA ligase [Sandaracinaceae bacterium]
MRYRQAFIPTLKEVPKDATSPSHVLLLRAGYVRMVGAGIYEMLPLGQRVLTKISNIVRREMNAAGAQELLMPALLPAEYFRETGRWDSFGDTLVRLRDRRGNDYHLGPTHEEIITDLVRREVKSYRQLPLNLYQVQMKYRDEPRPRGGLLRCREFLMKDAYSFDVSMEAAEKSYATMRDAYHAIFRGLGLHYRVVRADSGAMGGSTSAEFQVLTQTGEDAIVACSSCEYAANAEVAEACPAAPGAAPGGDVPAIEKVRTPKVKSIADVVAFFEANVPGTTGVAPETCIKSLIYVASNITTGASETVMVVVRGDHEVNDIALARHLGADEVRMATEEEVKAHVGAAPGFIGPVGYSGRVIVDPDAAAIPSAVGGANENPFHSANIVYGRDYEGERVNVRLVRSGDLCVQCGAPLETYKGIEGGHVFILGTHYSEKMGATFLDESGKQRAIVMGCYGIGVSRLMATAVEQHHDDAGIRWPMAIAPFQVIVSVLGDATETVAAATAIYDGLRGAGVDVLLDDRDERPGVKFKDAELLGIPLRVTVGARALAEGNIEMKERSGGDALDVPVTEAVARITERVVALGGELTK